MHKALFKAIILAGGRGQRLLPLTNSIPKSMITIGGRPILEHIINYLKNNNITDCFISLCYLPQAVTSYFGDGKKFGVRISYIYEDETQPMGTAGAIIKAQKYINNTFIVTYGDILRELDVNKMIAYHQKKKALATIHTYKRDGKNPKSIIKFNRSGRITSFEERPKRRVGEKERVWANGSFYIFEPEIFKFLLRKVPLDFSKDVFPRLIKTERIFAFSSNDFFIDIGTKEKLEKAQQLFPKFRMVNNGMP